MTRRPTTVIVTGAAGQDGALLSRELVAEGCRVVGVVQPGTEVPPEIRDLLVGVELLEIDLTDVPGTDRLLRDRRPDELYNLAGISSVAMSWQRARDVAAVNGTAVLDLLLTLHDADLPTRFLQASSAEMFGNPDASPQSEATPVQPRNPYAVSKAFAHHTCATFRAAYGMHVSTVILYNHESTLRPPTFVTRKITRAVAAISLGLQDRVRLGNLDVRRDWGHASDVVDAMRLAVRHDAPDDYVVATGVEHSLRDLVALAFGRVGIDDWERYVEIDPDLARPTDAPRLVGDASKARSVLGWAPRFDFASLVAEMVDHDLQQLREAGDGNA